MNIKIEAYNLTEEQAETLTKIMRYMQMCGEVGTTQQIAICIDGDGDARMKFNVLDMGEDAFPEITIKKLYDDMVKRVDEASLKGEDGMQQIWVDKVFGFPPLP